MKVLAILFMSLLVLSFIGGDIEPLTSMFVSTGDIVSNAVTQVVSLSDSLYELSVEVTADSSAPVDGTTGG